MVEPGTTTLRLHYYKLIQELSNSTFKLWPTRDLSLSECNGGDTIYRLDERGALKQWYYHRDNERRDIKGKEMLEKLDVMWDSLNCEPKLLCLGSESRLRPYLFSYPERSLTIEEILNKFIDEGKQEHEETRAFIYDFQTNNELLFKERNNSLIELRFGVQELLNITSKLVVQTSNEVQPSPVPFPRRLRKEKDEAQQKKLLENLKQLHINLPFIEALAQIPKYAKFLKSLLTNKARLEEACKIIMNERCSAVLLNKLPSKEKDPGSFTIPCDIGQLHIDNSLADLGASLSLMPYTMYKKLGLGEPKATRMSLELADRPFLATARAMIDVFNKKITLRVRDDEVVFDIDQSIKRPTTEDDECYKIDDLDETINEETQELLENEESDSFLSRGLEKSINQSDLECCESTSSNEKNGADS
ncbi:hypothetical protein Tco_1053969 [Tanacetum coccineum]|uniref:Uncharacterized protein n=1 Tax=Tanacetum coccineum TaxID=301880 RepID=A0ABQ5GXL7_9ASTR